MGSVSCPLPPTANTTYSPLGLTTAGGSHTATLKTLFTAQLSAGLISMRHSPSVTKATSCSAPSGVTAPAILVRADPFPSSLLLAHPQMTGGPRDSFLQPVSSPIPVTALCPDPRTPGVPSPMTTCGILPLLPLLLQAGSDGWCCQRPFLGYSTRLIWDSFLRLEEIREKEEVLRALNSRMPGFLEEARS